MKVSVFRKAHFNAAHRLHNPALSDARNLELFGLCNNPSFHGHNYMLEVRVKGEIDPLTGYVMDTKILKDIIREEVLEKFDHRNLNLDTVEFKELNPTAENIAVVIWGSLRKRIDAKLEMSVRLYETENNYVEFDGK
jgi:6-pyruvoyltetrahydropterin/6-carboxytetrahydropterin synthase